MKTILLDTKTGKKAMGMEGFSSFSWSDNNHSCDCNRRFSFDLPEDEEDEDVEAMCCKGCHRFLVVDAEVDHKDDWTDLTLRELNEGYPLDLLTAHGVDPKLVITKDHKLTPMSISHPKQDPS